MFHWGSYLLAVVTHWSISFGKNLKFSVDHDQALMALKQSFEMSKIRLGELGYDHFICLWITGLYIHTALKSNIYIYII